jgi:hypothetical protein
VVVGCWLVVREVSVFVVVEWSGGVVMKAVRWKSGVACGRVECNREDWWRRQRQTFTSSGQVFCWLVLSMVVNGRLEAGAVNSASVDDVAYERTGLDLSGSSRRKRFASLI